MIIDNTLYLPIAVFYLICAVVSFFGNGLMILCFIKEKKFNYPCYYFITLTCVADMLHLCGHFVFIFQFVFDITCSQEQCFWMLLPSSIGLCLSCPLILSLGIDRLIACISPVMYRNIISQPYIYIACQLFFPAFYTSWFIFSAFLQRDPELQVVCKVPVALSGTSLESLLNKSIAINALVFIVYFASFMKLRTIQNGGRHLKNVFKSILYTVGFFFFGWSTTLVWYHLGLKLIVDKPLLQLLVIHSGIGLNMACASNVFIFYVSNIEYRRAIERLLFGKNPTEWSSTTRRVTFSRRLNECF